MVLHWFTFDWSVTGQDTKINHSVSNVHCQPQAPAFTVNIALLTTSSCHCFWWRTFLCRDTSKNVSAVHYHDIGRERKKRTYSICWKMYCTTSQHLRKCTVYFRDVREKRTVFFDGASTHTHTHTHTHKRAGGGVCEQKKKKSCCFLNPEKACPPEFQCSKFERLRCWLVHAGSMQLDWYRGAWPSSFCRGQPGTLGVSERIYAYTHTRARVRDLIVSVN